MFDDPATLDLTNLFRDPDMFDSRKHWASAGFQIFSRSSAGKIMVARHPAVQGLLFKRYMPDVALRDQLKNYERRLEGARRLRTFVEQHGLSSIVVPHKWIVELPRAFSHRGAAHILVVEELAILGEEPTRSAYRHIAPTTLLELCRVLYRFRGMDSNSKNLPFTTDGKIALVDTEHWDRRSHKAYLHHLGEHLDSGSWRRARKIFRRLEDGQAPGGHDRYEGSEDLWEDTSSSSS